MAKQTVGPIVRHLEKAILAIAAGAFLYVVATHGVVSPNKVSLEGQRMGPAEVDKQVKARAETLREKLLRAEPSPSPVPDPMPQLRKASDPLDLADLSATIPRPVQFAPPIPEFGKGIKVRDTVDLVEVVPLGKLQVALAQRGRSGVFLAPPADFGQASSGGSSDPAFLQDVNWVTVSASFGRREQERLCRQANYDPKRIETIFLGADLQRRVQLADGSYADWTPVQTTSLRARPTYPAPEVYEVERGGFNVSDEQRAEVEKFFEMIREDENQLDLMRPSFPPTEYGSEWRYPRSPEADVLKMDAEYQSVPTCRYAECATLGERIDPRMRFRELLDEAEQALDQDKFDIALAYAEAARNKTDRDREKGEADKLIQAIGQAKAAAGQPGRKRTRLDTQLLWGHDAGIGSVLSGRIYQYRMRARIYNRYCGTPTLLSNPHHAEKIELVGPWSDASDPVSIPLNTILIVKSARAAKRECKVEVFKWVAGVWVMKAFNVAVGDHIGGDAKVDTPRALREPVNFDTGAIVVDIDYHRPYRSRSRKGGKLGPMIETTALTYVNETGQLREQLLDFDKYSQGYKDLRAMLYKPPRTR